MEGGAEQTAIKIEGLYLVMDKKGITLGIVDLIVII